MKTIKLSDLKLNDGSHGLPKNPRFIRDDRFKKLCDSIRDFPEAMPARGVVVDERGVILGGNMRYRACLENGMKEIPASWVHRLTGLTMEQKRRFIIMDNRAFGEDDFDLLGNEWDLKELIDAGFSESDLTGLIVPDENKQIDEKEMKKTENECPKCGFKW
jgi:ParB-like chromosome segregation protein Spo0J